MKLPEIIPIVSMEPPFKLPEGKKAYCHHCQQAFDSIEDIQQHNREQINKHQGNS